MTLVKDILNKYNYNIDNIAFQSSENVIPQITSFGINNSLIELCKYKEVLDLEIDITEMVEEELAKRIFDEILLQEYLYQNRNIVKTVQSAAAPYK